MKPLTLMSLGVAALILPLAAWGQAAGSDLRTPKVATAVAAQSPRLRAGQTFVFQLRFDHAPEGYTGGSIACRFENTTPEQYARPMSGSRYEISADYRTAMIDGEAVYTVALPITERMAPGTWKLVFVRLGETVPTQVKILNDVTFQISGPPAVPLRIEAPNIATAGQKIAVNVIMGKLPSGAVSEGCELLISATLRPSRPVGNYYAIPLGGQIIDPARHSYEFDESFPPDLPGDTWHGEISITSNAIMPPNLSGRELEEYTFSKFCPPPPVMGNTEFSLQLEPNKALVTPTSVSVTVNPSQADLLLGQVDKLRAEAQRLASVSDVSVLQSALLGLQRQLDQTESAFKTKGDSSSAQRFAIDTFFDDIRYSYGDALKALGPHSASLERARPHLVFAGLSPRAPDVSIPVITSIMHNADAYQLVASTHELTFTLEVLSSPQGATVSYRLRGSEYHYLDHDTDWKIENLPRAVYLIRVQKPGYLDQEKPFDAIDETVPTIKFDLKRKH